MPLQKLTSEQTTPQPPPLEGEKKVIPVKTDSVFTLRPKDNPSFITTDRETYLKLKGRSRDLRNEPTKAERFFWSFLRKRKLGYRFRRQQVIASFIVDFVCLEKSLIIEVDGEIHDFQKEADHERTLKLESTNFKVIRFKNEDVLANTEKVLKEIYIALKA